jgi:hypothetical protein
MDVCLLEHSAWEFIGDTSVLRKKTGLLTKVILLSVMIGASTPSLRMFENHICDRGHNFAKATRLTCFWLGLPPFTFLQDRTPPESLRGLCTVCRIDLQAR